MWGEVDVVVVVVEGQEQDIDRGRGYSPSKPKTKCPTLGISLASKLLVESVVGTHWVRGERSLKW